MSFFYLNSKYKFRWSEFFCLIIGDGMGLNLVTSPRDMVRMREKHLAQSDRCDCLAPPFQAYTIPLYDIVIIIA